MSVKSKKVMDAQSREEEEPTDREIAIVQKIFEGYPDASLDLLPILLGAVQWVGAGRNRQTAQTLRAVADILECPIDTAETIEARLDGKLQ